MTDGDNPVGQDNIFSLMGYRQNPKNQELNKDIIHSNSLSTQFLVHWKPPKYLQCIIKGVIANWMLNNDRPIIYDIRE